MTLKRLRTGAALLSMGLMSGVSPAFAQAVGSACSAGQVSGPDSVGNNLICSGGVFVAAGGYGGGAGATDRISTTNVASGATLGMVVADQGTVSFTLGGTPGAAYLHPTLGLVGPGISASTGISTTSTGYFGGNVGIGTTSPDEVLNIQSSSPGQVYVLKLSNSNGSTNSSVGLSFENTSGVGTHATIVAQRTNEFSSSDTDLRFSTVGLNVLTERLRIRSNGNVGIGTTAPTSALQVSGTFTVSSTVTNANPALYVSSSGNVGIGTTSPNGPLHVYQKGTSGQNTEILRLETSHTTPTLGASTRLAFRLYNNNAANSELAYIDEVYDSVTAGSRGTALAFSTSEQNTGTTEKLRINRFGNVGIGTTNPSGTLWVSGTVGMTRYSAAPVACSSGYAGLMAMTSTYKLCACDGSGWVYADSTVGACSW